MYGYMSKPKKDKTVNIPDEVLRHLLTVSEVRMLKNRFQIANLLEEGLPVRKIAFEVKVGTDTVIRVSRMIEKKEIRGFLGRFEKQPGKLPFKTKTPWIFGGK